MATKTLYHYFLTLRLQPNGASTFKARAISHTYTQVAFSCLAVRLTLFSLLLTAETGEPEAVVETRFPSGDLPKAENSLMGMITQFCFPDKEKFPKHQLSPKSRKFTFVVTNIDGAKRFGYVRRSLTGQISISNKGMRWPVAHCILSAFPCHSIFDQILESTARLEGAQVLDLMSQLRNHSLPAPGDALYATVTVGDATAPRLEPFRFSRPEQESSLSGFADFKALLTTIDPFTIASILMALLMERRVIFISRKLSTLSSCVQACVALLYPFSWQHVFIPVLPLAMIQFVCAPVPFVVGLLASHLPELQAQSELMEEVLLIDVESSSPVPPSQDFKLVPEKYLLPLVATIAKARRVVHDEKKKSKSDKSVGDKLKNFFNSDKNSSVNSSSGSRTTVALAEYYRETQPADNVAKMIENAFISFFAETMGHYTNYLTATEFDKEAFLAYDSTLEPFLRGVAGSQLFEQFIVQRQSSSRIKGKTGPLGSLPPARVASSTQADLNTDAKLSDVIIREGYISKWGKGMKGTAWARLKEGKDHRGKNDEGMVGTFQLRYWKMNYFNLTYHKSEDSKPSGSIALQDIEVVNLIEFRGVQDCLEIVTAERVYQLHTDNNADVMWWHELMNWKIAMLREYFPRHSKDRQDSSLAGDALANTRANTAPPASSWVSTAHGPMAPSQTLGAHSRAGSGSTQPEQPPASMPPMRTSSGGILAAPSAAPAATAGGPPVAPGRPPLIARTGSKTIVSSYMKDRVSSDRAANGGHHGPDGPKPVAPPKPEKYITHAHSQPLAHSQGTRAHSSSVSAAMYHHHPNSSSSLNASSHAPSAPPPAPPPTAPNANGDHGATRGRAAAMRSTSASEHAASGGTTVSPRTASDPPATGGTPPSATLVASNSHSTMPGTQRPTPPSLQSSSSRPLKRFNSQVNEDEGAANGQSASSAEENAHQEHKTNVINRLSLSPPKVRPLPPTPGKSTGASTPSSGPSTPPGSYSSTTPRGGGGSTPRLNVGGSASSSPASSFEQPQAPASPSSASSSTELSASTSAIKKPVPLPPKPALSNRAALTKTTPSSSSPSNASAPPPQQVASAKRPLPKPPV